jgi:oligopeptide/dipeptide ABC transporter ATP-binding protein
VILITHDLAVVAETAQRVIVMYAGKKVEEAEVERLFGEPQHPYTHGLLGSIPHLALLGGGIAQANARLQEIPGMVPALTNLPPGCSFAPRCRSILEQCKTARPELVKVGRSPRQGVFCQCLTRCPKHLAITSSRSRISRFISRSPRHHHPAQDRDRQSSRRHFLHDPARRDAGARRRKRLVL